MKKLVILLTPLSIIISLSAPTIFAGTIQKGTISVAAGSNSFLTSSSWEDDTYADRDVFNLSLEGGYFIADNMEIGALFGFNKETLGDDYDTTTKELVPFFGYHHPLTETTNLLFRAGVGVGSLESDYYRDTDFTIFYLNGGAEFFLNQSVSVNCGLIYQVEKYDIERLSDDTRTTLGADLRLRLYF